MKKNQPPFDSSPFQDKTEENLSDLRIFDLELFITAANIKSLGQAAKIHHLSQSAASAAIQRVEKALAQPLCTHERRQFRLTREGELLLPRAENWLNYLREILLEPKSPPIRIATTHAIAFASIPAIVHEMLELKIMRPDKAYGAIIKNEADIALVLDNAAWEGVTAIEIGKGKFQLYSREPAATPRAVLLPEDQIEVLRLQQQWQQLYTEPLSIKARIPSWSLIAEICSISSEIGFLPDFLGRKFKLRPLDWQPKPSSYRILALYRNTSAAFLKQVEPFLKEWTKIFKNS